MLGNLDLLTAVAGGVELEGVLAYLFRPTVGLTVCTSSTRWNPQPTAMTQGSSQRCQIARESCVIIQQWP
jgi:hypothetical protein